MVSFGQYMQIQDLRGIAALSGDAARGGEICRVPDATLQLFRRRTCMSPAAQWPFCCATLGGRSFANTGQSRGHDWARIPQGPWRGADGEKSDWQQGRTSRAPEVDRRSQAWVAHTVPLGYVCLHQLNWQPKKHPHRHAIGQGSGRGAGVEGAPGGTHAIVLPTHALCPIRHF